MNMMRDRFTEYQEEIDALVAQFDLAPEPVALRLRGLNGGLDYGDHLLFGKRYRVLQDVIANRKGNLPKGTEAYFLGYYVFPYDGGLRLYFEAADGQKFTLEFEEISPCADGELDRLSEAELYFQPVEDTSARGTQLAAAREAVLAEASRTDTARAEAREAARPAYEKQTDAAIKTFGLPDLPAIAFVNGTIATMDFPPLQMGRKYKVIESIAPNRGDALIKGQVLRFLGAYEGEDKALGLFFETDSGEQISPWFVPDAPQKANTRRYFRDPEKHVRPVLLDLSKRRKQLTAARAVLLHLRRQQEASS